MPVSSRSATSWARPGSALQTTPPSPNGEELASATASEAVELANSSSFGLGGAVYSADPDRAAEVADLLETGMVWINSPQGSMADLPFGGTKRSGVGRGVDQLLVHELVDAVRA